MLPAPEPFAPRLAAVEAPSTARRADRPSTPTAAGRTACAKHGVRRGAKRRARAHAERMLVGHADSYGRVAYPSPRPPDSATSHQLDDRCRLSRSADPCRRRPARARPKRRRKQKSSHSRRAEARRRNWPSSMWAAPLAVGAACAHGRRAAAGMQQAARLDNRRSTDRAGVSTQLSSSDSRLLLAAAAVDRAEAARDLQVRVSGWRCCRTCRSAGSLSRPPVSVPPPIRRARVPQLRRQSTSGARRPAGAHRTAARADGSRMRRRSTSDDTDRRRRWRPVGIGRGRPPDAEKESLARRPPRVATPAIEMGRENVVTVARHEHISWDRSSGELRAQREANVRAEIGGSVLSAFALKKGRRSSRAPCSAPHRGRTQEDAYGSAQSMVHSRRNRSANWLAERELTRTEQLGHGRRAAPSAISTGGRTAATSRGAARRCASAAGQRRTQLEHAVRLMRRSRRGVEASGERGRRRHARHRAVHRHRSLVDAARGVGAVRSLAALRVGAPVELRRPRIPRNLRRDASSASRRQRIRPPARCRFSCRIPNSDGRLVAGLFAEGRVVVERARRAGRAGRRGQHQRIAPVGAARRGRARPSERHVQLGLQRPADRARRRSPSASTKATSCCAAPAQGITPGTSVERHRHAVEVSSHVHLRLRDQAPGHHRRGDAGARGVRRGRADALETDEFPDVQPPVVVVAIPYPGRVARHRRARSASSRSRRRSPGSAASTR